MKKKLATLLATALCLSMVAGCGGSSDTETTGAQGSSEKEQITMWFWGAEPYAQEALNELLAGAYNASQDQYELVIEYDNSVDKNISVALSANQGPDIVYGSGPSFVMPFAEAGKLEPMDAYAEQYGWKDEILAPLYESGTVDGTLYSLPNSISVMGIFYNKQVLADYGWDVPTTLEDLEAIMDEAMELGLYASATGNKGWQPVNENYASLFLTHFAGPEVVYDCLTGAQSWNNPAVVDAINYSAEWYQKGYLGGDDYINLNFSESIQILADGGTPFFIGPSIGYQWAVPFFTGDNEENLGFIAFPSGNDSVEYPTYTLGVACTLSINANSAYKDEAAKIIDMMMQPEFMQEMTAVWPGYWGTPLQDLSTVDTSEMSYLAASYVDTVIACSDAVNNGNFGYYTNVFFPAATQQVFIDIENVWNGVNTAEELMDKADAEFVKEMESGLVPPIPVPGN